MDRYQWRDGARFPVKAQVAGERLAELRAENDERLTPEIVVDDARPEEATLHPCFEWDDAEAAEKYRHEQARSLIRSVRVLTMPDRPPAMAYVNVSIPDVGPSYVTTARAMSDDDLREQAIADALSGLRAWQRRHEHLTELGPIFAEIERTAARLERRRRRQAVEHVSANP